MTTVDLDELSRTLAMEVVKTIKEQELLSGKEDALIKMDVVAKELRVTPQTIIAWRKKGYFPGYQIGSKMYYKLSEVIAGMNKRQVRKF
jgi:hypothetical protein